MVKKNMPTTSFCQQLRATLIRNLRLKWRDSRKTTAEIFLPLYTLGTLIVLKILIPNPNFPAITESRGGASKLFEHFQLNKNHTVAVVPHWNSTTTMQFLEAVNDLWLTMNIGPGQYPIKWLQFETNEELLGTYWRDPYKMPPLALVFNSDDPYNGQLQYEIRTNPSKFLIPPTTELYSSLVSCRQTDSYWSSVIPIETGDSCPVNQYYYSGFLALQTLLDFTKIRIVTSNYNIQVPLLKLEMFPKEAYTGNWMVAFRLVIPIYMVMALSQFITYLLILIVGEKENHIKEGLKIMGLRDTVFWLSWFIIYAVFVTFLTLVSVILLFSLGVFQHTNYLPVFVLILLYSLSVILIGFMITPFFDNSRTAGILGNFAVNIMSLLYFIQVFVDNQDTSVTLWIVSLISPTGFALAMDKILVLDISGQGVTLDNLWNGPGIPLGGSILMMAIDIVLYAALAFYLDCVVPSEHGTKQRICFCLSRNYWCKKKVPKIPLLNGESASSFNNVDEQQRDIEPVSREMRGREAIRIVDLHKTFHACRKPEINAVNGINLTIYEGQITAILGHNGAGKSTLFNILTGLTAPTNGTAYIFGYDVRDPNDMTMIRRMTGVCPQHDILFEQLTPKEHLYFFAAVRGISPNTIESEVKKTLRDIDLYETADTRAKNLSGGQKRKLSVGIAIIGDPKIIILDEPTAGVDPYSRRHMWSILQNRKHGKVILLTTHFMDEADILADRKAVISRGRLRCCGSSLFLKNKFGIGYHLTLVLGNIAQENLITKLVKQHVQKAERARRHGRELSYILPHDAVDYFASLFSDIEVEIKTNASNLGICSYGVSMTTLEEVFLHLETQHDENEEDYEDDEEEDEEYEEENEDETNNMKKKLDNAYRKEKSVINCINNEKTLDKAMDIVTNGIELENDKDEPYDEDDDEDEEICLNKKKHLLSRSLSLQDQKLNIVNNSNNQQYQSRLNQNFHNTNQHHTHASQYARHHHVLQKPLNSCSYQSLKNIFNIKSGNSNAINNNNNNIMNNNNNSLIITNNVNNANNNNNNINGTIRSLPDHHYLASSTKTKSKNSISSVKKIRKSSKKMSKTESGELVNNGDDDDDDDVDVLDNDEIVIIHNSGDMKYKYGEDMSNSKNKMNLKKPMAATVTATTTTASKNTSTSIRMTNSNRNSRRKKKIPIACNWMELNQIVLNPNCFNTILSLLKLRCTILLRDIQRLYLMIILPLGFTIIGLYLNSIQIIIPIMRSIVLDNNTYGDNITRIAIQRQPAPSYELSHNYQSEQQYRNHHHNQMTNMNRLLQNEHQYYPKSGASDDSLLLNDNFMSELSKLVDLNLDYDGVYSNLLNISPNMAAININSPITDSNINLTALYNDTIQHSLPIIVNILSNTIMNMFISSSASLSSSKSSLLSISDTSSSLFDGQPQQQVPLSIVIRSHPFQQISQTQEFNIGTISSALFVGMIFVLIPVSLSIDMVYDREMKAKNQLRVNGLTPTIYFMTYFILLNAIMFIICLILLVLIFIFQIPSFSQVSALLTLGLLIFLYTPSSILCSTCFSYFFDRTDSAQSILPNILTFIGLIPFILVIFLDMLGIEVKAALTLHYIFSLINPMYIPYAAVYFVDRVYVACRLSSACADLSFENYMTEEIIVMIVGVLLHIPIWLLFLRIVEIKKYGIVTSLSSSSPASPSFLSGNLSGGDHAIVTPNNSNAAGNSKATCSTKFHRPQLEEIIQAEEEITGEHEDEDVRNERARVYRICNDQSLLKNTGTSPVVIVKNLRKEFQKDSNCCNSSCFCCTSDDPPRVCIAVRCLSLAIEAGEVLGLLGHNGAGKTTTMKIMTGETMPTTGQVQIGGHNITVNQADAFKTMGYCPQHDALWKNVTVREHLEVYASIRGVSRRDLPKLINTYLSGLHITEHANKQTQHCSGGTRRKLSYAMAMVGAPKVVLLDEPSTGMDPKSKRFLWDTILASKGERGAILTTHSMEEADALSSRVGIMVKGELRCLGSTQHLKNLYGAGYTLEIKLKHIEDTVMIISPSQSSHILNSTSSSSSSSTTSSRSSSTSIAINQQLQQEQQLQQQIQEENNRSTALRQFVTELFPDASLEESFADRLVYSVPQQAVSSLAQCFSKLEKAKHELEIEEYSFSQTTLEQVFLKFAHYDEENLNT